MTTDMQVKKISSVTPLIIFMFCTVLLLIYGSEAKAGAIFGINLSAFSVIPSMFPFFILSDFLFAYYNGEGGTFGEIFERVFFIPKNAYKAFIIGSLCGFPLGAKCAAELYNSGKITKKECESLCGLASNPSLAFVISGVGLGMRESLSDGVTLYITVIFSAIAIGILFRGKHVKNQNTSKNIEQKFDLSVSIKNAAYSSLGISSYIIFFSTLLSVFSAMIKNNFLSTLISPFFEIGNASSLISKNSYLDENIKFALTAFALSFSGLSVYMQTLSFLPKDISKIKIFLMKLLQGFISFILAYVIFSLK